MGLLDDAIREHLDLKRRRGADPAEIERLEREALGPVRRGPEAVEPTGPSTDSETGAEHGWSNGHDSQPNAHAYDYAEDEPLETAEIPPDEPASALSDRSEP